MVGKSRKVRSDKKKSVQPSIEVELKDCIYRVSYITGVPVKDIIVELCMLGAKSNRVMTYLSDSFRRDIRIGDTVYRGSLNRESNRLRDENGSRERISSKFTNEEYEILSTLSYALDCGISRACGILLEASLKDIDILNDFLSESIERLDRRRILELKKIFNYVNDDNPYHEKYSWNAFVEYIGMKVREVVDKLDREEEENELVIHNWRDR